MIEKSRHIPLVGGIEGGTEEEGRALFQEGEEVIVLLLSMLLLLLLLLLLLSLLLFFCLISLSGSMSSSRWKGRREGGKAGLLVVKSQATTGLLRANQLPHVLGHKCVSREGGREGGRGGEKDAPVFAGGVAELKKWLGWDGLGGTEAAVVDGAMAAGGAFKFEV